MSGLASARRQLIALRVKHKADSPIGSRCSTAIELLQNIEKPEFAPRTALLRGSLKATLTEIAQIQAGGSSNAQVRRECNVTEFRRNINELSLDRLREVLDYDPATGALTWRVRLGPMCKFESYAGSPKAGYRKISIDGRNYTASHLAWFHFYGKPPLGFLDHKNGDRGDDRIENLREATAAQNSQNIGCRANSSTGLKGASRFNSPRNNKKFRSTITVNGKRIHLGQFDTAEEAHAAYCAKAAELHGEFANTSGSDDHQ